MTSAFKDRKARLAKFLQALKNDSFIAKNQHEAYEFLKKHLDAVELAALPSEKHSDYTVRMNIPGFGVLGAWSRAGAIQEWKAFGHVIQISDTGGIDISAKTVPWFSRPGAV